MNKRLHTLPHFLLIGLFTLLCFIHSAAFAKTLKAQVDRTEIEMGDVLTLTLTADFHTTASPHFDRLMDQFELLSQQVGSNVQFVNGQYSIQTQWQLTLLPKQEGVLMIPPFEIEGVKSSPIKIHVQPMVRNQGDQKAAFFLQATADPLHPYVQQAVHYRLRLFYQGQLIDGNLRAPQFKGTLNQLVVNQKAYLKQLHGTTYQVYEWDYVLYPQQSGTLKIAPASFRGRAQWQGFLKILHLQSDPITLKVKPHPKNYPAQAAWLPAHNLTLSLKAPQQATAGDTIPLTLTLTAQGLLSAQLPKIDFPQSANYKHYLDHIEQHDQWQNGEMVSQKIFHYLLVPVKAGKLNLPVISLPWWSLKEAKVEIAKTQPIAITVQPSANLTPQNPSSQHQKTEQKVSHETLKKSVQSASKQATLPLIVWGVILLLLLVSILLLALWWHSHKQLKQLRLQQQNETKNNTPASEPSTIASMDLCQQIENLAALSDASRQQWIDLYQQVKQKLAEQNRENTETEVEIERAFKQLSQHLFAQPEALEKVQPALQTLCHFLHKKHDIKFTKKSADRNRHLDKLYP